MTTYFNTYYRPGNPGEQVPAYCSAVYNGTPPAQFSFNTKLPYTPPPAGSPPGTPGSIAVPYITFDSEGNETGTSTYDHPIQSQADADGLGNWLGTVSFSPLKGLISLYEGGFTVSGPTNLAVALDGIGAVEGFYNGYDYILTQFQDALNNSPDVQIPWWAIIMLGGAAIAATGGTRFVVGLGVGLFIGGGIGGLTGFFGPEQPATQTSNPNANQANWGENNLMTGKDGNGKALSQAMTWEDFFPN